MMAQRLVKYIATALLIFSGVGVVTTAHADRFRHGGWGWGFSTGLVGGAVIGSHFGRPYYYQPYAPYSPYTPYPSNIYYQQPQVIQAPPVYIQAQPPVGTIQTAPPIMPSQSVWYFCEPVNNFYPNVPSCAEPWKVINTNPSSAYSPPPSPPGAIPQ